MSQCAQCVPNYWGALASSPQRVLTSATQCATDHGTLHVNRVYRKAKAHREGSRVSKSRTSTTQSQPWA